jgi:hypothetical protein
MIGSEMTMHVATRNFQLDTPDWNALYYVDAMLRDSRDPTYTVFSEARTDNPPAGPCDIVTRNENSDLIVVVVCFALAEHMTQLAVFVSGDTYPVCEAERDNIVNEIIGLNLN